MPCSGLPVPCINRVQIIFLLVLWVVEFIFCHLKNRVPLTLVLGGVAGVAHYITGHEHSLEPSLLFSFL